MRCERSSRDKAETRPGKLLEMKRTNSTVEAKNKRAKAAGDQACARARSRGVSILNHGAGTMPVGAPAPHGGERYTLLTDGAPACISPLVIRTVSVAVNLWCLAGADASAPTMVAPHDGRRTDDGKLFFADAPSFCPLLTPRQCLLAGVFGGCYFNPRTLPRIRTRGLLIRTLQ